MRVAGRLATLAALALAVGVAFATAGTALRDEQEMGSVGNADRVRGLAAVRDAASSGAARC